MKIGRSSGRIVVCEVESVESVVESVKVKVEVKANR